jgi:hypothetical protein
MMGGAYTVLALVVVLLLTAAEFSFALYAFRSGALHTFFALHLETPIFRAFVIAPQVVFSHVDET